jgi:hypothetical protein
MNKLVQHFFEAMVGVFFFAGWQFLFDMHKDNFHKFSLVFKNYSNIDVAIFIGGILLLTLAISTVASVVNNEYVVPKRYNFNLFISIFVMCGIILIYGINNHFKSSFLSFLFLYIFAAAFAVGAYSALNLIYKAPVTGRIISGIIIVANIILITFLRIL